MRTRPATGNLGSLPGHVQRAELRRRGYYDGTPTLDDGSKTELIRGGKGQNFRCRSSFSMRLFIIKCVKFRAGSRAGGDCRIAVVVGPSTLEAVAVCQQAYEGCGYDEFDLHSIIDGEFPGPPEIIGYSDVSGSFDVS